MLIIARLDELRLAAIEQRVDADLLAGVTEPLADQLGADPSAELSAFHLELLRAEPERPAQATQSNLPAGLASLVGRDDELSQVAGLLGPPAAHADRPGRGGQDPAGRRGGLGRPGRGPGGVWLVELAPVTDPAEVPSAVLAALGLREQALMYARGPLGTAVDADALSRLLAALAGRRALLVLDNCEHLVAAAARLAGQVLAACPQVRILATSREPLAITGEALWTVGSVLARTSGDPPFPHASQQRPDSP